MTTSTTSTPPFHRLLSFYSNRSPHPNTQTIRLQDSLTGNLSLGLDFPVAFAIALGRHLWLSNTTFFSLNIHVPSVPVTRTLLDGVKVEEKRDYSCGEIAGLAREVGGWKAGLDALGLWVLAADVRTGGLRGADVRAFNEGTLFGGLEARRKGRGDVLPLWRGGPISVAGHSWVVKKMFGVDVYRVDSKDD